MLPTNAIIAELETALEKKPSSSHSAMLRAMTDLFVDGPRHLSADHVAVFDAVIGRLIVSNEPAELASLSVRLAPIEHPPMSVARRLSSDDNIAIARPLLEQSSALPDDALIHVAKTKSPHHLLAIAGRPRISEPVTDALLDRGNSEVTHMVAKNEGACLSEVSYAKLINRSRTDKPLAQAIAKRKDLPNELKPFLNLTLDKA